MNNIPQKKMKAFTKFDAQFAVLAVVALIISFLYFGNTYLQIRASKDAMNISNQKHVAQTVFSTVDLVTEKAVKEIECLGSEKPEVTCKTIGSDLFVIKFRTKSPIQDFRIHALRNVVDSDVHIEIRKVSGFPQPESAFDVEKLAEIFSNPITVE